MTAENLPLKAILLLDNAPCHPPAEELVSEDGSIFVMYMPPNVTPLIQPMDQNIIRLTKLHYRTYMLNSVLSTNQNVVEAVKCFTLKEAVINLYAAWNKIEQSVISKCWNNILGKKTKLNDVDEDDIPLSRLKEQMQQKDSDCVLRIVDLLNASDSNVRICISVR